MLLLRHIKRNCQVQGLTEEGEIEFIISKGPFCENCKEKGHWEEDCPHLIKRKEYFEPEEVSFDSIPSDIPYQNTRDIYLVQFVILSIETFHHNF